MKTYEFYISAGVFEEIAERQKKSFQFKYGEDGFPQVGDYLSFHSRHKTGYMSCDISHVSSEGCLEGWVIVDLAVQSVAR